MHLAADDYNLYLEELGGWDQRSAIRSGLGPDSSESKQSEVSSAWRFAGNIDRHMWFVFLSPKLRSFTLGPPREWPSRPIVFESRPRLPDIPHSYTKALREPYLHPPRAHLGSEFTGNTGKKKYFVLIYNMKGTKNQDTKQLLRCAEFFEHVQVG